MADEILRQQIEPNHRSKAGIGLNLLMGTIYAEVGLVDLADDSIYQSLYASQDLEDHPLIDKILQSQDLLSKLITEPHTPDLGHLVSQRSKEINFFF